MSSEEINVYVELDCLLDTRIATIDILAPEEGQRIVKHWYHKRTSDNFNRQGTKLDQKEYEKLYHNRDIRTLRSATMTPLLLTLPMLINQYTATAGKPYDAKKINVNINTYPYDISDEGKDVILSAIHQYHENHFDVKLVYQAPETLTPNYLNTAYQLLFIYNFDSWLELHRNELVNTPIPNVVIATPRLYLTDAKVTTFDQIKNVLNNSDVKTMEATHKDPFLMVSVGLSRGITVVFLDVALFSYIVDNVIPDLDG